jgi:hypothetical protein
VAAVAAEGDDGDAGDVLVSGTRIAEHDVFSARSRGDKFAGYSALEVMCCPVCGVLYAVPERLLTDARRRPTIYWCCPNGDELHFPGKSPEQEAKEARNALARERARHDQTAASLRATKGVVTKMRKRIGNGVCPCCNRSFRDLARHMDTMHPGFAKTKESS